MKICTEQDCLQAHLTLIEVAARGRSPILHRIKQRLTSMLITSRSWRDGAHSRTFRNGCSNWNPLRNPKNVKNEANSNVFER
jgi:hypothetical protein